MLTFAVVVSRRGGRIPEPVLDWLRDRNCVDVPFAAADHLVWSNEASTVWFGGWEDDPAEWSAGNHWHVDDDGLTAFTGHLWPARDGWTSAASWAAQLAGRLRSTPLAAATDDLAGVYLAAALGRRGRGTVAADPLGGGLIYWGHGRDVVVVSSRAALAAGLLAAESATRPQRDVTGVGWLAYCSRSIGHQTGFEQVSVVPTGATVDIDPAGGACLVDAPAPPWRPDPDDAVMPADELEEVRTQIVTSIRMALALPGRASRAGLTGGRDSRLLLALMLEEGVAGEVEFQTFGRDDLADVVVAAQIAELFGLRQVMNPNRSVLWEWRQGVDTMVRDDGHPDLSTQEITHRITAWACSGERNVFQPHVGRLPRRDRILLSGLFGETLRTNFPRAGAFPSKQRVADLHNDMKYGSMGILRPDALAHYRAETHRLLFDDCLPTDSPHDVVDRFFFRNWQRRWFASAHEVDSEGRVFPLYSNAGVRLGFRIGGENRTLEWIHYELIRRACEPLLHVPFADGGWPAGAGDGLVVIKRHDEPVPAVPRVFQGRAPSPRKMKVKRTAGRDRRAASEAVDLDIMNRYLRDDPSNPLFEIVDPVATGQALDRFDDLTIREKLQLYGALTGAIWLGGHEIALPG